MSISLLSWNSWHCLHFVTIRNISNLHWLKNKNSTRSLSGCPRANKPKSRHKDGAESEPLRWFFFDFGYVDFCFVIFLLLQSLPCCDPKHTQMPDPWLRRLWPRHRQIPLPPEVKTSQSEKSPPSPQKSTPAPPFPPSPPPSPSERACPIAAKMAKSLNSSRNYSSAPIYPAMEEYGAGLSCPMGICL